MVGLGKKLLVVVAHPDDEVLGCAGMLLKNHSLGGQNYVLYLNDGCHYRDNFNPVVIRSQMYAVSKLLKFKGIVLNYKTGMFDNYMQKDINDAISQVVDEIQPNVVITHICNDLHIDHRIVNQSTMVACRYIRNKSIEAIYEMPVISSSEINPQFNFTPNVFVDITEYIDKKKKAMQKYVYEVESMKELRGDAGIDGWATFYGMHIGVKYAEAYKLIRCTI